MNHKSKTIFISIFALALFVFSIQFVLSSVPFPVNVGSASQTKTGALAVGQTTLPTPPMIFMGLSIPGEKLHVKGAMAVDRLFSWTNKVHCKK